MDKRRAKRSSSGYQPARISFAAGETAQLCVVHNRSDRGLCIELMIEADELPDRFELSFDNFQTIHVCKTVWRDDNIAGVSFESPSSEPDVSRRAQLRLVK
jgi:PilZ domain-containing protein